MRVVPTWLGAHEIPLEFRERDGGRRQLCRAAHPRDAPRRHRRTSSRDSPTSSASRASSRTTRRVRFSGRHPRGARAQAPRRRAEPSGGAELAAELGATSADHLAAISRARASRRSRPSQTVATLLPGTMLFLGKPSQAPARRADRGGGRRRARDRLQSRHVTDGELPADPHPRRQPAPTVSRGGARRGHGQRRSAPRPRGSRRPDRAGLFGRSRAVRHATIFASCHTGTATVVSGDVGTRANLVTLPARQYLKQLRPNDFPVPALTASSGVQQAPMSNVAKLKKRAAEFEQKKQFDKALAVYLQILEEVSGSEDEGRRSVQPRRRPHAATGQRQRGRRLLRAGGRPVRRGRLLQQRHRALQQDPAQRPGAELDLLQAREDQREEGIHQRREEELPRVRRPDAEGRASSTKRFAR